MKPIAPRWAAKILIVGSLIGHVNLAFADVAGKPIPCDRRLVTVEPPRPVLLRQLLPPKRIGDLNPAFNFADLATVALRLHDLYPPETHYVIGIGRSPFALVEMMNLTAPGSASSVQISYNEYLGKRPRFILRPWKRALDPYSRGPQRDAIFAHLRASMPTPRLVGGRKIVILDFADYGSSLAKFSVDLRAYLEHEGRPADHELIFLGVRSHDDNWYLSKLAETILPERDLEQLMARYARTHVGWWQISDHPEYERQLRARLPKFRHAVLSGELDRFGSLLDGEAFKRYAPYGHFVGPGVEAPASSPSRFERFVTVLRGEFERRMLEDPAFRALVKSSVP